MSSMMGNWWPGMTHHGWRSQDDVSMSTAVMGMLMGFALGMLVGLMKGKTMGMMMSGGGHGMHMKRMWKKMHHHHGYGSPACCQEHEGSGEWAAPGARPDEDRNEGE